MTKTTNYQLPQWEARDPIRRGDFNAAMAAIDVGIAEAQGAAEALPYVVGTYTGVGDTALEVTVGFCPSFVLIWRSQKATNTTNAGTFLVAAGRVFSSDRIYMTEQGFRMEAADEFYVYPTVNISGTQYEFIAFR